MKALTKTFIWITLFSIAMGYLETAVVIYMRHLIYHDTTTLFPLRTVTTNLAVTELWREAATIIMLIGIGVLTGKNALQRFAYFIYSFAIWDIFYYVFLKVMIDWPESLFTWDILFLIPAPWVGPVITPCLAALSMIILACAIILMQEKGYKVQIKGREWTMMISGCVVMILSFMWDYIDYVYFRQSGNAMAWSSRSFLNAARTYVPEHFNWLIYFAGMGLLWFGIGYFVWRTLKGEYQLAKSTIGHSSAA